MKRQVYGRLFSAITVSRLCYPCLTSRQPDLRDRRYLPAEVRVVEVTPPTKYLVFSRKRVTLALGFAVVVNQVEKTKRNVTRRPSCALRSGG